MILGIILLLFALWILGFLVFHVAGALVHLLLIVAVIVVLVRIIQGKRVL
jgi:hypothetical protein